MFQSHVFINQLLLLPIYPQYDIDRKPPLLGVESWLLSLTIQEWFQKQNLVTLLKCDDVECKSEMLFCTVEYTFIYALPLLFYLHILFVFW